MTRNDIGEDEAQEIMRIATEYCRSVTDSEEEANKLLSGLAAAVQEQGAKLVHLGNVLFLVLVRAKGTVEIHTLGEEKTPKIMAERFAALARYLKSIGVTVAYTYSPDAKFKRLARLVDLKVRQYKSEVEGQKMNVFVVEL